MNPKNKNPHNFITDRFAPRVVTIVGGKGSMGQRLAEEFFKDSYEVRLTGEQPLHEIGPTQAKEWRRAIRRWNENVCKDADVVIFSVPIPLLLLSRRQPSTHRSLESCRDFESPSASTVNRRIRQAVHDLD